MDRGRKGRRAKATQGGGSEARKEKGGKAEKTKVESKEGGSDEGRWKREPAPRTTLKNRGCNSSALKTILFS